MGGSSEWDNSMMDSLKNFDLSSPEVKQQFGKYKKKLEFTFRTDLSHFCDSHALLTFHLHKMAFVLQGISNILACMLLHIFDNLTHLCPRP